MKYIKKYEIVWGEITDFAKSLKVGDFFKYQCHEDLFVVQVINKYKDYDNIIFSTVNVLYYNGYAKEWRYANDKSMGHRNLDFISFNGSPITDSDIEIKELLAVQKYNL